jgi:hypothetical protein
MAPLFHVEALLPSSISPKIDSILHSHIYPQVGHVFRAVAKFKALLIDVVVLRKKKRSGGYGTATAGRYFRGSSAKKSGAGMTRASKIAGFVKTHFTHSSSTPARAMDARCSSHYGYEYSAAWNAVIPAAAAAAEEEVVDVCNDTAECGYLCWLEEEEERPGEDAGGNGDGVAVNEIDRLAEKFIARFHAKFLLEKQESYRRYQEMIARSI